MDEHEVLAEVLERLTRMESRLVQLMLHVGLDPNSRRYQQKQDQHKQGTAHDTRSY